MELRFWKINRCPREEVWSLELVATLVEVGTHGLAVQVCNVMTEEKRALLIKNTVIDMMPVTYNIKYRHAAHCYLADKEYGIRLAEAMNLDIVWVEHLASLSEEERLKITESQS